VQKREKKLKQSFFFRGNMRDNRLRTLCARVGQWKIKR